MNLIKIESFELKMMAVIGESATVSRPRLRAWSSAQYEFIVKGGKNIGCPNCAERAQHLMVT
jgi:hypothetical protein